MSDKSPDPQHRRPAYLAGKIDAIVVAIGTAVGLMGIRGEFSDLMTEYQNIAEKDLESSPSKDYHTGRLHVAERIVKEIYRGPKSR